MNVQRLVGVAAALAAFTFSFATALQAQTIRAKAGDWVSMTGTGGEQAEGVLRAVGPSALTVLVSGREEQWRLAESREIWKQGDSLLNGIRYGMLIGVGAGLLAGYGLAAPVENEGGDAGKVFLGMTLLGVGGGAGIGAAVDAMRKGRTLIHRGAGGATVIVTPAVSPNVRGLQVAVRF